MDRLDRRDDKLASVLEQTLSGGGDEEFANRVVAAAEAAGMFDPAQWWEVLGEWARPGLIAAAASTALLIGASVLAPRSQGDAVASVEGLIVAEEAAGLAAPLPPDPETMMAAALAAD